MNACTKGLWLWSSSVSSCSLTLDPRLQSELDTETPKLKPSVLNTLVHLSSLMPRTPGHLIPCYLLPLPLTSRGINVGVIAGRSPWKHGLQMGHECSCWWWILRGWHPLRPTLSRSILSFSQSSHSKLAPEICNRNLELETIITHDAKVSKSRTSSLVMQFVLF